MLKQLVQLFAEKFLVSKKEWVGHQAFPHHRVGVDIRSNRTLHLQTDGLAFVRSLLTLIILLAHRAELLHGFLVMRTHLFRQQQHCLFLRVKHLPSTSQAEYQKFGSHQLTVPQLNFALGGASC